MAAPRHEGGAAPADVLSTFLMDAKQDLDRVGSMCDSTRLEHDVSTLFAMFILEPGAGQRVAQLKFHWSPEPEAHCHGC